MSAEWRESDIREGAMQNVQGRMRDIPARERMASGIPIIGESLF